MCVRFDGDGGPEGPNEGIFVKVFYARKRNDGRFVEELYNLSFL